MVARGYDKPLFMGKLLPDPPVGSRAYDKETKNDHHLGENDE